MAVMLVLSSATGRAIAQDRTPAPQTEPHGFVSEPLPILRTALFAGRSLLSRQDKTGIYLDLDDAVPAPSWLAAGPGYRYWSKGDRLLIEGSAAISWRGYRRAHARVELPRLARGTLAIGSQLRWQTLSDVNLFAQGPDSLESSRREYRLRSTDVVGYAALRPLRWAEVGARIGWLNPSVSTAAEQPSFLHVECSSQAKAPSKAPARSRSRCHIT
jgi:hypothetical protein